jgi:hypothetical protein
LDNHPKKSFRVRKRWGGDSLYLIHRTDSLKIDALSEAIWDHLNGKRTPQDIVTSLQSRFSSIDPLFLEALVAHNITIFLVYDMLDNMMENK